MKPGTLFLGDNLDVLRRRIPDASVDLVYLDPPFNSNRDYNMLFAEHDMSASKAQLRAFEDSWHWDLVAQQTYEEITAPGANEAVANITRAFCQAFPRSDMAAYLVMMAVRLVEMHRVLKPTGSLYLHCDPTASHYLKMLLDAIFGARSFFSEIVWKRYGAHGNASRYGAVHDVLLFYGKTDDAIFNKQFVPYTEEYAAERFRLVDDNGRRYQEQNLSNPSPRPNLFYPYTASNGVTYHPHPNGWKCDLARMKQLDAEGRLHFPKNPKGRLRLKMYLDECEGVPLQDVWTDIPFAASSRERIGYPTQKPLALLERIIKASSNEGDVVLDPFCGCGTTIHAAQRLKRTWVGIDVTFLAIRVIEKRMKTWFPGLKYVFDGFPRDVEGALALADRSPHNFQEWAVQALGAEQTGGRRAKAGRDEGVDGKLRFRVGLSRVETAIIQVKGGKHVGPTAVRDLVGTMSRERSALGILFTAYPPTSEMKKAAAAASTVAFEGWNSRYPKVQLISADEWFAGKRIEFPGQSLTAAEFEPPGSRSGENLVLPGIEAPPTPPRRATIVQISEDVAAPPRPAQAASRPARTRRAKS